MRPVGFAGQVERFRGDVAAVLGRDFSKDDVFAVAVSGGPDSMALLALAYAAWPGQVIAATVDHGLRTAAADEAAMVAGWCATLSTPRHPGLVPGSTLPPAHRPERLRPGGPRNKSGVTLGEGVPHIILRPPEPLGTANIQATARTARYALLTDWAIAHGATLLATAHHADDQAETFLMRAARGSGLAGLSGIRPKRGLVPPSVRAELVEACPEHRRGGRVAGTRFDKLSTNGGEGARLDGSAITAEATIPLIRPLLDWRRDELRALVEAAGIPFIDDPSNADDRYDRTRFRHLLADNAVLDPIRLAETARYVREGNEALDAMIDWLWQDRKIARPDVDGGDHQTWLNLAGLPREIRRRLAREAIGGVRDVNGITRPAFSPATNIEPMLDAVEAGTAATQAGILVSRRHDIWHFRAAPPRRDTARTQS